jgi:hypothetical protein
VPGHLHRDALGNSGADKIANSRATEVVQHTSRTSGSHARRPKRHAEGPDRPSITVEDVPADHVIPPLQAFGDRSLSLEKLTQLARHRKRSTFAVLRPARIEADFAGAEIDLPC